MSKTTTLQPNLIIGDYQILKRDYNKQAAAIYWEVKCIHCGRIKTIRSDNLKKNNLCKFCNDKMIDKIFGDFTVLSRTDKTEKNSNNIIYRCKCNKCGNEEEIVGNYLRLGRKQYCSKCHIKNTTLIDLTGQDFGYLTVLQRDTNPKYYGHFSDPYWVCKCNLCGSIKSIRGASLKNGSTKSCGCMKSHGETLIAQILNDNNISYQREFTFDDLYLEQKNCKLRFDFAIFENNKLSHLIEYDGIQHFQARNDNGWNNEINLELTQLRDKIKNQYCQQHNIKLIRIKYDEEITFNKLMGIDDGK